MDEPGKETWQNTKKICGKIWRRHVVHKENDAFQNMETTCGPTTNTGSLTRGQTGRRHVVESGNDTWINRIMTRG